jgi:molybdenum cofactor biosynthesis enzyme MoaA
MKVLCLGNNTLDTDQRCQAVAQDLGIEHRGLIHEFDHCQGVWHTSVMDLARGKILALAQQADRVIMLAQSVSSWNHPDAWLRTVEIVDEVSGEFQDTADLTRHRYWQDLLEHNQSFCILPWVEHMTVQDHAVVCCRSNTPISHDQSIGAWRHDAGYENIRSDMLQARLRPDHCRTCYQQEKLGLPSDRRRETLEWVTRLGIDSVKDLETIQQPVYFEMRASNRCNLKCRTCGPEYSHLIAHERRVLKILPDDYQAQFNNNRFDHLPMSHVMKLYVAGGEPLIMEDFMQFLSRALLQDRRDLELVINTNCTVLTPKFQNLISQFTNVTFIISIDGIGEVNDYIRSNSTWNSVVENWRWLHDRFTVTINTTVSMYNASRLHEIFEFLDQEFPNVAVNFTKAVSQDDVLDPLHHPRRDLVMASIDAALDTKSVDNGPRSREWLESFRKNICERALNTVDISQWRDYNDQLDRYRDTRIVEILPELVVDREST